MFIAHVVQKNEGCDYTIACGEAVWRLKASTKTEAIEELRQKVLGEYLPEYNEWEEGYWNEDGLAEVTLFEVGNEYKVDISQWYKDAEAYVEKMKCEKAKVVEREEYERLKKKFEN